ncbi:MAG: NifU family protein [Syntrophales bacterium]|nr:NifU family protein [Syntrophales bacterium]
MKEKVEAALSKIKPMLAGVDVVIREINDGVLKVQIFMASCGVGLSKEMVMEMLEEHLNKEVPEVKEIVAV